MSGSEWHRVVVVGTSKKRWFRGGNGRNFAPKRQGLPLKHYHWVIRQHTNPSNGGFLLALANSKMSFQLLKRI